MNILITGAAGYIGSHIIINLIEQKKFFKLIIWEAAQFII